MEDFDMKAKFYICNHCGNLVTTIHNAGVPLVCCGEKMKELVPNTVEASGEKHLPVAELSGSRLTVTVGAVEHPMADVHYIQWIFVETENGGQIRYLNPGQAPNAVFELGSEKPVAVYAYCNLHGLWMTKLLDDETLIQSMQTGSDLMSLPVFLMRTLCGSFGSELCIK